MVATLNGLAFDQIYPDNSGGAVFDTDGDGVATQEDEFVAVRNLSGSAIDISGWQIWSDGAGGGAPDTPQDGLYHTFPPGTVIASGARLWVINEITGTPGAWAQEASAGGVESGAGGVSTNLLTEGDATTTITESVVLLDPSTGDYIVFNMADGPFNPATISGFPGTNKVAEIDGQAVQADPNAGSSYQYDENTDSYTYQPVFTPCLAQGTGVLTPSGERPVEALRVGDLVLTVDDGPQPVRLILFRELAFRPGLADPQRPIECKPGSLGPNQPRRPLILSPQHRVLVRHRAVESLAPVKALLGQPGFRVMMGCRRVRYHQLVFDRHQLVICNGAPVESFLAGPHALARLPSRIAALLQRIAGPDPRPARPLLRPGQVRRQREAWNDLPSDPGARPADITTRTRMVTM